MATGQDTVEFLSEKNHTGTYHTGIPSIDLDLARDSTTCIASATIILRSLRATTTGTVLQLDRSLFGTRTVCYPAGMALSI